jgi:hypothetical protein
LSAEATKISPGRQALRTVGRGVRFLGRGLGYLVEFVYKAITRSALYLVTSYLLTYFALNSDAGRADVMNILTQSLPGDFSAQSLQWGPFPHELTLLDVVIRDPVGDPTIIAPRASVLVDWDQTRQWLLRKVYVDQTGTEVLFSHATVENPRVRIDVERDGWTGISTSFSDRTAPDDADGVPTLVRLDECRVENATITVGVSGVDVNAAGVDVPSASVHIYDGRVRVVADLVRSSSGFVQVDGAGPAEGPLWLPWREMQSHEVIWDDGKLDVGRGRLRVSETTVSLTGSLDTRGKTSVDLVANLDVPAGDPLVAAWSEDLDFGGAVTFEAHGPVAWPQLVGNIEATRLRVGSLEVAPLAFNVTLSTDPFRRSAKISPLHTSIFGGDISFERVEYRPGGNGREDGMFLLDVGLYDVHPSFLHNWGFLDGQPPPEFDGTAVGRLSSRLTFRRNSAGDAGLAVDGDIDLAYEWDEPSGLLPAHTEVVGRVHGIFMPEEQRITTDGVRVSGSSEQLNLEGQFDVKNETFDLAANVSIGLREFLGRLGIEGWSGQAALGDARITGTLSDPWVKGRASLSKGNIAGLGIERFEAMAMLDRGLLSLQSARAKTSRGAIKADVNLRLWDPDIWSLSSQLPLTIKNAEIRGLSVADLGIDGIRGTATVNSPRFELQLGRPGYQPAGRLGMTVSGLRFGEESFKTFNATVLAANDKITIPTVTAVSDGDARFSGSGSWDQARNRVQLALNAERVDLTRLMALEGVPLRGVVDVRDLSLTGSPQKWGVKGRIRFKDFGYAGIYLGDADIGFSRARGGGRVRLTSNSFFPKMDLKRGELKLGKNGLPRSLVAQVGAAGVDVLALLPALNDSLDRATISQGDVLVELPLASSRPFRLVADLPHDALQVRTADDAPMISNTGPMWASLLGDTVKIDRFVVTARGQKLATCGKIKLSGALDIDVAGNIELNQVTGLKRVVSDLEGSLSTGTGQLTDKDPFEGSCLRLAIQDETREELGSPTGFVRIENALEAPTLQGAVNFSNVRMIPRGLGREIAVDSGVVELRASKGLKGSQEIEFSNQNPLRGSIDEGAFQISGRAKLPPVLVRNRIEHWLPDAGYIDITGTDLYWAKPKVYRVVLDPQLRLRFRNLWQPDEAEITGLSADELRNRSEAELAISGKVSVPEGTYFESFTLLARSIGSVLQRREIDGPTTSITKSIPVLQRLQFDNVEVRGENLVVQSDFGVGKTDLDTRFKLNVRGTLDQPRLHGFLDVSDGTLTYTVFRRMFEVTRGRLDFDGEPGRPKLDILAETSIEAPRAGAGRQDDEFEDYAVQVAVTGRIPDYKLTLSSKPTLPEIDIQYLILLGKTKQQLADEGFGQSSLELVSADIGSLVSQWIEAPFLDEVRVQPTVGGGGRIEAILRLGRSIRIGLVGRQEGGVTSYDARFRQKIRDNILLEAIRRGRGEDNRERQRYEVQLKYTIPVD